MEILNKCPICEGGEFSEYLQGGDFFLTKEIFTIVKCKDCNFIFVNPRPSREEIFRYYKSVDYISHSNTNRGLLNKIYHLVRKRNHNKKYRLISGYVKSGVILDIGCATGEFLNYFKKKAWITEGVEPDKDTREFAEKKHKLTIYSEEYLDIVKFERYDVITMWHVLEHIHLLKERILQTYKLLKKEGVLIVAVPNATCYDAHIYGKFWAGYDLPRHIYHFTQDSIVKLFADHNFRVERIVPMKYDAYYISLLSEKYLNGSKNIIKAFINGYRSNKWAKKNNNNYSSLIFVFKKNEPI